MTYRVEFSRKQKAEIHERAKNSDGVLCCEGCGLVLGKKPSEVDHIIAEALQDHTMQRNLTIEDGQLLGRDCCHKPKTANDVRDIAKVKRVRDKHNGTFPKPRGNNRLQSRPFNNTRNTT